nr:uncharacterized protein LOC105320538 [Crassostrea gigas]
MLWSCLELLKMSCWMSFWVATFLTTITVCRGLCNLGRLENVRTDQSSTYKYDQTFHNIELTADRAVNGRFLNHSGGDCAGTDVSKKHTQAWWNISLPDPAIIYKINLMFRENNIRHYGYYVFINKEDINIEGLTSLTPVYHEENEKHPGVQNIIMFPGGIQGKQTYIYQNKSKPINDNVDQQNNVLDICEVEIWGCFNYTEDVNCTCSQNESDTPLPKAILSSIVAWPNNTLTLICHQGNVKLGDTFKPKLDLIHNNNTISFTCFDGCECPCKRLASQNFIKDPIDLQQRIEEIKKFLAVNRSELSAFKRKKISSYDGRASSTGIGMTLGVGVITFVIGAIVCSDLLTCKNRNQRRMFRKTL